jgi:hypothetical protein
MQVNAGFISLIYPMAVFGYACLEETRPKRQFWQFINTYTTVLLCVKFIWNLSIFNSLTPMFMKIDGTLRIGLHDFEDTWKLTLYLMPEILIITTL